MEIMKSIVITVLISASLLLSAATKSMELVELKLISPEKFRDAQLSNSTRSKSFEKIEKDLAILFEKVAVEYIKPSQKLKISINDVDLVGYIDFSNGASGNQFRIVKDLESFKLKYSFEAYDATGKLIKSGDAEIKDFVTRNISRFNRNKRGVVYYYEDGLKEWFESTFSK